MKPAMSGLSLPPITTQGFYHAHCDDIVYFDHPLTLCGWDRMKVGLSDVETHRRETGHRTVTVTTLIGPAVGYEREWARRYGQDGPR